MQIRDICRPPPFRPRCRSLSFTLGSDSHRRQGIFLKSLNFKTLAPCESRAATKKKSTTKLSRSLARGSVVLKFRWVEKKNRRREIQRRHWALIARANQHSNAALKKKKRRLIIQKRPLCSPCSLPCHGKKNHRVIRFDWFRQPAAPAIDLGTLFKRL